MERTFDLVFTHIDEGGWRGCCRGEEEDHGGRRRERERARSGRGEGVPDGLGLGAGVDECEAD